MEDTSNQKILISGILEFKNKQTQNLQERYKEKGNQEKYKMCTLELFPTALWFALFL